MLTAVTTHQFAHPTHPLIAPIIRGYFKWHDRFFPPHISPHDLVCFRNTDEDLRLLVGTKGAKFGGRFYSNTHTYLVLTPRDSERKVLIACVPYPSNTAQLLRTLRNQAAHYQNAYAITHNDDSGIAVLKECAKLFPEITHFKRLLVEPDAKHIVAVKAKQNGELFHGGDLLQQDVTSSVIR